MPLTNLSLRFALACSTLLFAATAAAQVKEVVHLKVTGGPHAGTFDATSDRGGCSVGLAGPRAWGNQLSLTDSDPNHFNSLQLVAPLPDNITSQFFLSIGFGPLAHRTEYTIETRRGYKKSGTGVMSIIDKGTTARMTFSGTTAGGIKLEGTIDCKTVLRGDSA
jgi:hypothetical protein